MKKIYLILFALVFLPSLVFAQTEKKSFDYYYAEWCSHCQKVNKFFTENGIYEKYDVHKFNFDEDQNKIGLKNLFQEKGYGDQIGIPAVVVDGKLIAGDKSIIDYFQPEIKKEIPAAEENKSVFPILTLVGAALVDAINPCAFAVLILLLATVIAAKGKNQAFFSGLFFSLAVFISYFLMGLGLYKAITVFNLPKYVSIFIGFLAIIIGLANLKDYFWHGKFFVMEVPISWRPKMQAIIKHATSPLGAFGAGFLVSLFLLPCTSGPYVVILGLLAEKVDMAKTLSLLALYNLIFILPMILITAGMYFGIRMGKVEEIRKRNVRILHAVAGAVMLFIGIYLLYEWI
jgi:cytochrome c biogenesis protein CcdA/glutaredoxin